MMRPETGGATGGLGLFTPGATGTRPDAGRGLSKDQGMGLTGLFSWLTPHHLSEEISPKGQVANTEQALVLLLSLSSDY